MGEFRIGRKYARHVYPDTNRGAGLLAYARNSASAIEGAQPAGGIVADPGVSPLAWADIESTPGSGGASVPITPKVTGILRVVGMLTLVGPGIAAAANVRIDVLIDGAPVASTQQTVEVDGVANVGFQVDRYDAGIGAHTVALQAAALTGADANLKVTNMEIDIQELPPVTG